MRASLPCLLLPGWLNSGVNHWQSRWQRLRPDMGRVDFGDWEDPEPVAWNRALRRAVEAMPAPPVLIAHSLGCLAAAALIASEDPPAIAAALLVAPADPDRADTPAAFADFAPVARRPFRVPGMVIFSSNDPYAESGFALSLANAWGLEPLELGPLGHINADSGLGDWPEGLMLLDQLLARVTAGADSAM